MKEWLSIREVARLCGVSIQQIHDNIKQQRYDLLRERKSRGRTGKTTDIHYTALPPEVRRTYEASQNAPQPPTPVFNPLEHPAWAVSVMEQRVRTVREWDLTRAETPKTLRTKVKQAFCQARQISTGTLYNWERLLRDEGEAGLMPKYPRERKQQRVMTDDLKGVIRSWYLTQNKRSAAVIHEMLEDYCQTVGMPLPSYSSVAHYVGGLSPSEKDYGRGTKANWRAKYEPVARRDWMALRVNEIWCGDHRQLDILCKQRVVTEGKHGTRTYWKVAAPWLTVWLDLASWCFVGWHLAWIPNSWTIALALRDGILHYGIPEEVYVDCGRDYRSRHLSLKTLKIRNLGRITPNGDFNAFAAGNSITVNAEGLLDALDIDRRHATPVNLQDGFKGGVPRAKPVEPAFNWFRALEHEYPGWRGEKPDRMPEATRKMLAKKIDDKTPLPLFEDVYAAVAASIATHNARPHGKREQAANAYFETSQIVRLPESQHRALDVLLWPGKPKVVKNSEIMCDGIPYMSPKLAPYGGDKLVARKDPRNIERVVVMTPGRPSEFVCVAENMEMRKMSWHPTSEEYKDYVAKPQKQARKTMQALSDAYETLYSSDAELLQRGKASSESADEPDDKPPTPPKGGRPKKKPVKKAGLQAGGKVYLLSDRKPALRQAQGTVQEGTNGVQACATENGGQDDGVPKGIEVVKVLAPAYHEAANAVLRADRQAETLPVEDTPDSKPYRYINGRWEYVGEQAAG